VNVIAYASIGSQFLSI